MGQLCRLFSPIGKASIAPIDLEALIAFSRAGIRPRRSVQPIMDIKEQLDFAAAQINALIEEYAPPSVKGTALIPRLFAFH